MRKINKKILVAALSLLLIACAFVTVLSFTMAADGDGGDGGTTVEASPSFDVVTVYNIDKIVENSNSGTDPYFHIVEVSSSGNYSAMSDTTVLSKVFTDYVFNGYKTIADSMKEGMIDYKPFNTVNMSSLQEHNCIEALAKADLIYVHNDSSSYFGKGDNDLPESIKLQLCSSATSGFVPFIIDGPIATQEIISNSTSSYSELVTKEFKKYGGRKYTYQWNTETQGTALQYFTHETSAYIQIDGKNQKDKWTKVYGVEDYDLTGLADVDPTHTEGDATPTDKLDRTKEYYSVSEKTSTIGRILVINGSAKDGAISTLVKDSITEFTGKVILEENAIDVIDVKDKADAEIKLIEKKTTDEGEDFPPIYNIDNVKLYSVPEDSGLYNAYISRNEHPDFISFEYYAGKDPALDTIDYSKYDIIIVEKGPYGETDLSADNYAKLVAAMNGNQHILYDSSLVGVISSGSAEIDYGDNYDVVCGKVMTATEAPKYSNVLVTNKTRMDAYMAATSKEAVKDIADIINYASYRGIGGGDDDTSNVYTVLEIQPAYPIDKDLAALFANVGGNHIKNIVDPLENNPYKSNMTFSDITGRIKPLTQGEYSTIANNSWYYLRNQGVLNDTTTDEITFDGTTSLTTFMENGDSITSNMLTNVTDYYAWTLSRAKVAHATNLDYKDVKVIHMSTYEFNCTKKTLLDNFDAIYIGGDNSAIKTIGSYQTSKLGSAGVYNMYFVNGDAYDYNEYYGKDAGSIGTLQGNDISEAKLNELLEYKKQGMPIIIGKDAVSGLSGVNLIDPNSNMFSFLKSCEADHVAGKVNIVWNFNYDDKVKILNPDSKYGNTIEGFVTVFGGTETKNYLGENVTIDSSSINEANLVTALKGSSQRPKLVVTPNSKTYNENDESTWLTDHNLTWKYQAAGGEDFKARLYFDDNANSRFEADEVFDIEEGSTGTLSMKLDKDYFGVVYWKVEVENGDGLRASTTGVLKIKRTDQEKMQVDILQIMPKEERKVDEQNKATLYLCTECQQSRYVLYTNRHGQSDKYHSGCELTLSEGFKDGYGHDELDRHPVSNAAGDGAVDRIKNYISNAQNPDKSLYLEYMPDYGLTGEYYLNVDSNLGVHDHRFGIVKYDSQYKTDEGADYTGLDDWNTNWFNQVKNDYNVQMNIVNDDEFEALMELIAGIYRGKDTASVKTLRSKFAIASAEFKNAYNGMVKVINGTYKSSGSGGLTKAEENALKKYMFSFLGFKMGNSVGETTLNAIKGAAATEYANLYPESTDETEKARWIEAYVEQKANDILYSGFETQMDVFASAGPELDRQLRAIKASGDSFGDKSAELAAKEIDYELSFETYDEKPYYDLFSVDRTMNGKVKQLKDFADTYYLWRDAKIYEQFFYKMYRYYSLLSGVDDSGNIDLTQTYNCVVFGAAKNFGGADITSDVACEAITNYIDNKISQNTNFTLTSKEATKHMTEKLAPYFGVNAATTQEVSEPDEPEIKYLSDNVYNGKIKIKFTNVYNNSSYGSEYEIDAAASEVNVVFNGVNGNNEGFTIAISDNSASNKSNYPDDCYKEHVIKLSVTVTNPNQWTGSLGANLHIQNVQIGKYGADVKNGTMTTILEMPSSIYTASDVNSQLGGSSGGGSFNPTKLTYSNALGQTSDTTKSSTFKYCLFYPSLTAEDQTHTRKNEIEFAVKNGVVTNCAERNNEGIVTFYPFGIDDNLRLTPTVDGDFTIKVDDPNMIVYYSLSGGTTGTMSTNYVADPKDGGNNYFVYQYQPKGNNAGTVTYLGCGNTVVTGHTRENNDERRFFINLILNVGRKSTRMTTLDLYGHKSSQEVSADGQIKSTSLIKGNVEDNGSLGYKMTITEGTIPKFSYLVTSDISVDIVEVWAYFDLDYDPKDPDDEYYEDDKHILVYNKEYNKSGTYSKKDNPWIASGYLAWVDEDTSLKSSDATVVVDGVEQSQSMLNVKSEYLAPYGNEYTYIVVKVVDTKGNEYYQRLKIIIKPALHDLT